MRDRRIERLVPIHMRSLLTCVILNVAILGTGASGAAEPVVERFLANPIIRPAMLPGRDGENINGPSLIRVPAWVKNPLGRYYLYFAHHNGEHIRLAYSDRLDGPWRIHAPGVLHLANAPGCRGHIASPDVIVDEERREIRMYFHGPARAANGQKSFVALSPDGLAFRAGDEVLGIFYFRVFRHDEWWYAIAKGGQLYRSKDGLTRFELGPNVFRGGESSTGSPGEAGPRHVAVLPEDGALWIYFSSIGDAPERIRRARLALQTDWREWKVAASEDVIHPEREWEGANLPIRVSKSGAARGRENALRDPAIFVDADDRRYLLYAVAGESGIAIAELK